MDPGSSCGADRCQQPNRKAAGEGHRVDIQAKKADRDSRFTPSSFLASICDAFGPIDLDPCGHELSPVVARRRLIPEHGVDGLTDTWTGRLVYLNPPFSQLLLWLRRAHEQWRAGNVETVVGLVPVRTDSSWFHEVFSSDADIFLLKGRVSFLDTKGKKQPTPFSLMIFTLGAGPEQKRRFAELVSGFWSSRYSSSHDSSAAVHLNLLRLPIAQNAHLPCKGKRCGDGDQMTLCPVPPYLGAVTDDSRSDPPSSPSSTPRRNRARTEMRRPPMHRPPRWREAANWRR